MSDFPKQHDVIYDNRVNAVHEELRKQFGASSTTGDLHLRVVAYEVVRALEESDYRNNAVTVPLEPSKGLLTSIALRLDHGLGCPGYYDQFPRFDGDTHQGRLDQALTDAKRAHEEIVGTGFYTPKREEYYLSLHKPTE